MLLSLNWLFEWNYATQQCRNCRFGLHYMMQYNCTLSNSKNFADIEESYTTKKIFTSMSSYVLFKIVSWMLLGRDGQSRTFGCSRTVLELKFSNPEFWTRSMILEAFWQDNTTKYIHNKFDQNDNSITEHVYYSATNSSNLYVPFSTKF